MSAEKTVIHNPHPGTNTKVGIKKILVHSESNSIILTLEGWGLVLQRRSQGGVGGVKTVPVGRLSENTQS